MKLSNKISRPITIKEQLYDMIKEQILNGTIKPGEWLQEKKLAEIYNVSRSPIREVLIELVGEGLLENLPNKGIFVKTLSSRDIYNIFEIRQVLEEYAISKAVQVATAEDIENLKQIKRDLEEAYYNCDVNEYSRIDTIIHNTIFSISGNDILEEVVDHLYPRIQSFRIISLYNKRRYEESFLEHKGILEGIIERDYDKAWRYGSTHLKLARNEIINHINSLEGVKE